MSGRVFIPNEHCPIGGDGACFRAGRCDRVYGSTCARYFAEETMLEIGVVRREAETIKREIALSGLASGDVIAKALRAWNKGTEAAAEAAAGETP